MGNGSLEICGVCRFLACIFCVGSFFSLACVTVFFQSQRSEVTPPTDLSQHTQSIWELQISNFWMAETSNSTLPTWEPLYPWKVSFRGQMKSNYLFEIFPNLSPLAHINPMKAVYQNPSNNPIRAHSTSHEILFEIHWIPFIPLSSILNPIETS